jgi:hypothetical protein
MKTESAEKKLQFAGFIELTGRDALENDRLKEAEDPKF